MENQKCFCLLLLLSVFLFHNVTGQTKKTVPAKQPNIIFILTDDLGYGDLGVFYQQQRSKQNDRNQPYTFTPYLDKLAAQGATLPNHYCAAPVCAPSRASILLGQSQGHANVRDNQFDKALANNHTMASTLRQLGYTTAAIGKWGLQGAGNDGPDWPAHPLNRGFDYYLGYMRHRDGHEHYPKEGIYRGAKEVWENRKNIAADLDKCYTGDLWTAAAKKWIVAHKQGNKGRNPFFIYLAYDTPHAVLELPTQAYPAGAGLKGGLQWLGKPGQMINTASGTVDSWIDPDYAKATYDHDKNASTSEVPWPDVYKRYATSVRRIDSQIGDLMQLLKDLNIDKNTIIVFTSDNGPSLESYLPDTYAPNHPNFFRSFGPFDGVKRDLWEGGVRMPTIVTWPARIPAKRIVTAPSINYDWLPTFTDAAGMPAPAIVDGVSLIPALTGQGKQTQSLVYVEYFNGDKTPNFEEFQPQHRQRRRNQMQLIRQGDYVGVRYDIQSAADDFEIYNVSKDPQEANNLAAKPDMADLQQQFKAKVLQVRRPDEAAPRPYDNELVPAITKTATKAGVNWNTYAGLFPWLPEVSSLKPTASGITKQPVVNAANNMKAGVLYFDGFLQIPADGTYTFYTTATTGAVFRLHNTAVIDADYNYTGGTELKGKVNLKSGLHPFRFYYAYKDGANQLMDLKWEGPGIAKQTIPANIFCQAVAKAAP